MNMIKECVPCKEKQQKDKYKSFNELEKKPTPPTGNKFTQQVVRKNQQKKPVRII